MPVTANGAAGITVTVANTAQLQQSGGSSAISLVGAGGHLLSNLGTISSVGGVAVQLGGGSRVENAGSISTGNNTALQFVGAGDSVLVNRGTISGRTGVQFGAGNDRLDMQAGSISGGVLQGDGNDVLVLGNGTIDSVDQGSGDDQMTVTGGTVTGVVAQGSGRDDFVMSGGTIGALQQGDNIDTFRMSGGRIIGAFEDGDQAWMTAGRIGRVNMKLDKNLWDQSGGTVDGNVVTGFDTDTIIISGTAYIGGNISVSGGNDSVTITDGTVRGRCCSVPAMTPSTGMAVASSTVRSTWGRTTTSPPSATSTRATWGGAAVRRWQRHRPARPQQRQDGGRGPFPELGDGAPGQQHRADLRWRSGAGRQQYRHRHAHGG